MIRESEACGIMSHGRDDHKQMQRGGSAAMAEETAAREAAAVAAGLLAYCTVLERQSLSGERATSESKKLGDAGESWQQRRWQQQRLRQRQHGLDSSGGLGGYGGSRLAGLRVAAKAGG